MKTKLAARMALAIAAIAGLLAAPPLANADSSPLLLAVPTDGFSTEGSLTVTTNPMPKGWFTGNQNSFDRSKTDVQLSVDLSASDCSDGVTVNKSSVTDGTFQPVLNSQGKVTAYRWSITIDLSSYQDHWHNLIHCDGSTEVIGCKEPRVVTVTATAYDQAGACHSYTNDLGQSACASDSKSGLLSSVQDADQQEQGCTQTQGCDIGACVSDCQTNKCGNASNCARGAAGQACRDAITACHQCCECVCKSTTAGCTPQDLCYTGSAGHPQCLSND